MKQNETRMVEDSDAMRTTKLKKKNWAQVFRSALRYAAPLKLIIKKSIDVGGGGDRCLDLLLKELFSYLSQVQHYL